MPQDKAGRFDFYWKAVRRFCGERVCNSSGKLSSQESRSVRRSESLLLPTSKFKYAI